VFQFFLIEAFSARMAPVKFMFERYGRVAVSIAKSHEAEMVNRILDIGIERGASEMKQLEESDPEAPLAMEVINATAGCIKELIIVPVPLSTRISWTIRGRNSRRYKGTPPGQHHFCRTDLCTTGSPDTRIRG